jgi:hypothetical protein
MSAKTCQLCGKTLSRLRVGGDSEFCSREHRNQYGLRRGMDRLEEVNKVTSLMRRRETPRQISAARLMCNSAQATRGFLQPPAYSPSSEAASFSPVFRIPEPPRLSQVADRYLQPRAAKYAGLLETRRPDTSNVRITGGRSALQIPEPARKLTARIAQARMASLYCKLPAAAAGRRDYPMLRQTRTRVHPGEEPASVRSLFLPGTAALGRNLAARRIGSPPLKGKALRVSITLPFRAASVSRHLFTTPPAMSTELVWPKLPRRVLPSAKDAAAAPRNSAIRIATPPACLPAVRNGLREAQFIYPGALTAGERKPLSRGLPPSRTSDVPWMISEPNPGRIGILPPSAGFARRNGVHLCTLRLTPTATNSAQHVAFRPFIVQEPVGCPTVPFEGTTAASIITAPAGLAGEEAPVAARTPAAAIHLEEHFGSGWDQWQGGMQDWLVDVAGVRTGSLALFVPTMELVDYNLEFLARIDTRNLTWVVRATDLQEYMRCTLTAIPGGELEFSRAVVRDGVAEPVVVAATRIPGKPRAAMTVRTQVIGDTFAVSVDGKAMDTWQEDRLYCGGIGFMGAPDDRARLYWVRLASTEHIGKEQEKK